MRWRGPKTTAPAAAPDPGASPPGTRTSDYDYVLPEGRIARYPAARRDESRLLIVDRAGAPIEHLRFRDVVRFFRAGDVLVVNESKVLPARLLGRKPSGAPSEVLLVRPMMEPAASPVSSSAIEPSGADDKLWEALVRPGSKLKPGRRVVVSDELAVEILDSTEGGGRVVRLDTPLSTAEALERFGHVPLPPYLEREDEAVDRERYQTVYARTPGSVAAPTAGLHFTSELLAELEALGVERASLELQVGVGTFRPVEEEDPSGHEMHAELYAVGNEAAATINRARARGGRLWAVGTTVVRTLETVAASDGSVQPGSGSTRLFIRPPYTFRAVDRLITNFHLPRSTLLMLVAAFAGYERTLSAYRAAIEGEYRFYSYGDAMLVL
jgi:S-adenosylmethionine:tRNA ribosyltransferase-isomerase